MSTAAPPAASSELQPLLCSVFGHAALRPGQQQAVEALLAGRDVVVLMPTGGGKSLCYQLPAVMAALRGEGLTVVVSPLIALMNDQVAALTARGVRAAALHSAQDELEQRQTLAHAVTGKLDLLYISPERAVAAGFRRWLGRAKVARLAVDEAHCISQWGHDFRPEYMRLGELRQLLGVATIAVTATATARVLDEIVDSLGLSEPVRVCGSFIRPNLRFSVLHLGPDAERIEALCAAIASAGITGRGGGRAIVYCATRKKVESTAKALVSRGLAAGMYHAGRSDRRREQAQRAFDTGRTRVLVATNAFGMGVDHPDVRLIVHFQTPGSLEAYYQEAGRAGRDGLPAECVLFFGAGDLATQRFLNRKQPASGPRSGAREQLLAAIEAYARGTTCRQRAIQAYFTGDDSAARCGACDVCVDAEAVSRRLEKPRVAVARPCAPLGAAERELLVGAAAGLRKPVGKRALARALRGSRARDVRRLGLCELAQHGALASCDEAAITDAVEHLIREGRLERRGQKYPTVWLAGRPVRPRRAAESATLEEAAPRKRRARGSPLARALEGYRRRTARALGWKRYMVFTNEVIRQLEAQKPDSTWALTQVRGLGPAKIERFGSDLLALVRRWSSTIY